MNYSNKINAFFEEEVREIVDPKLFNNTFEKAMFFLIDKILNNEGQGAYFIEVPILELVSNDTSGNYKNFVKSVINAAGKFIYNQNLDKPYEEKQPGIIFCRIYPKAGVRIFKKFVRGSRELFAYGTRAPYYYGVSNNCPKLLSENEYQYNSFNGTRAISNYLEWTELISSQKGKVVNGIKQKILILGGGEITKANSPVPCCIVHKDRLENTTPMESFVYLTVDGNRVKDLVVKGCFSSIICLGDSKFVTGDEWMITNNYFDKIIYIGTKKPIANAEEYYSFSVSEMHSWYDTETPDASIKIVSDENLTEKVSNFKYLVNKLTENGGSLKYPINNVFNFTLPLEDIVIQNMLDKFDEYLSSNLVSDSESSREQLYNAYESILDALKSEQTEKIDFLNKVVYEKNNHLFVMPNEVKKLKIEQKNKIKILSYQAYKRALKQISNSGKNNKRNKYLFFSLVKLYDIINYMDSLSILGEKILITYANNDNRIKKALTDQKRFNSDFLKKENRFRITGIEFFEKETNEKPITLDDFDLDLNNDDFYTPNKLDVYKVIFEDEAIELLSGSVLNEDDKMLWHLSELKDEVEENKRNQENDSIRITYYQYNDQVFKKIWKAACPELNEEINFCILLWKKALKDLLDNSKNKNELYENLVEKGWKTSKNSLLSLFKDGNETQFPRLSSLNAIRKMAGEVSELHKNFNLVKKAIKANSKRKEIGRLLAETLYNLYIDDTFQSELTEKINDSVLLMNALDLCLIKNTRVKKIEKFTKK